VALFQGVYSGGVGAFFVGNRTWCFGPPPKIKDLLTVKQKKKDFLRMEDILAVPLNRKRRMPREHGDAPCPKRRRTDAVATFVNPWKVGKRSGVDVLLGRFYHSVQ
jgi:hypothetical protein